MIEPSLRDAGMDLSLNYLPSLPRRKDFRIGCLGAGFIMADCHLVAYTQAGFNPAAIASRSVDRAREVAARHHIPTVHPTYEALLADRSLEILDIAVPPDAQPALIKEAAGRKTAKGIMAQKPLAMSVKEARECALACA